MSIICVKFLITKLSTLTIHKCINNVLVKGKEEGGTGFSKGSPNSQRKTQSLPTLFLSQTLYIIYLEVILLV